jgi:hypothetical protein
VEKMDVNIYPATFGAREIVAVVEVYVALVVLAYKFDEEELVEWCEKFQEEEDETPQAGFMRLVECLKISDESRTFWKEYFVQRKEEHVQDSSDPFAQFKNYQADRLAEERKYMATYMERYAHAGGFEPTPIKKLYALALADDHTRSTSKRSVAEDWLSKVRGEIKVNEAREIGENMDVDGKEVQSPDLDERNERARMWTDEREKEKDLVLTDNTA